jgi:hypothetical protein
MDQLTNIIEEHPCAMAFGLLGLACQLTWP